MANIKLVLEYDGSRYGGSDEIKKKVEEVLSKMTGTEVVTNLAMKTEAGVHAYQQVLNYRTESTMKGLEIKQYLNRYLPRDIACLEASYENDRFHASFSAKSFTFEYHVTMGEVPSVFDRKYNFYCFKSPDVTKMKEAAAKLIGEHDLAAFSENKRMKKSTVRHIESIDIYATKTELTISIKADDFWPNMARIIVGTLLDIGTGKIDPAVIGVALRNKEREVLGETAKAQGLFLAEISYAE